MVFGSTRLLYLSRSLPGLYFSGVLHQARAMDDQAGHDDFIQRSKAQPKLVQNSNTSNAVSSEESFNAMLAKVSPEPEGSLFLNVFNHETEKKGVLPEKRSLHISADAPVSASPLQSAAVLDVVGRLCSTPGFQSPRTPFLDERPKMKRYSSLVSYKPDGSIPPTPSPTSAHGTLKLTPKQSIAAAWAAHRASGFQSLLTPAPSTPPPSVCSPMVPSLDLSLNGKREYIAHKVQNKKGGCWVFVEYNRDDLPRRSADKFPHESIAWLLGYARRYLSYAPLDSLWASFREFQGFYPGLKDMTRARFVNLREFVKFERKLEHVFEHDVADRSSLTIARQAIQQYREEHQKVLNSISVYMERKVGGVNRYDGLRAAFNRVSRRMAEGEVGRMCKRSLKFGVGFVRLPGSKYNREIKKKLVRSQNCTNIYSIPAGQLSQEGEKIQITDKSHVVGIVNDTLLGISQVLRLAVQHNVSSPLLSESVASIDSKFETLHVVSCKSAMLKPSHPGWMKVKLRVAKDDDQESIEDWEGELALLEGAIWADGVTASGDSRMVVVCWIVDRAKILFRDQVSATAPILDIAGGEKATREKFVFGDTEEVTMLGNRLNLCFNKLERAIFLLPDLDGNKRGFAIDLAYHTFDGKAYSIMMGTLYGTSPRSLRDFFTYLEMWQSPSLCVPDGTCVRRRGYEEYLHDFKTLNKLKDFVRVVQEDLRPRILSLNGESQRQLKLNANKSAHPRDILQALVQEWPIIQSVVTGSLAHESDILEDPTRPILETEVQEEESNESGDADDVGCGFVLGLVMKEVLSTFVNEPMRLIVTALFLVKYFPAAERGTLTDAQSNSFSKDMARLLGEVTECPILFERDINLPIRFWQDALGNKGSMPEIMVRSLHSAWKVLLQLAKVTGRHGVGMWVSINGIETRVSGVDSMLDRYLNQLLRESDAHKSLSTEDLITRKGAIQLLDAFMSPSLLPFLSYTYKVLVTLGRIIGRLYALVSFEDLPGSYATTPEPLYGIYSLVYACMHCTVVYRSDKTAANASGYLQDYVASGMKQVQDIGLAPGLLSEARGEAALQTYKRAIQMSSSHHKEHQLPYLHTHQYILQEGDAEYQPRHKLEAQAASLTVEGSKVVREVVMPNLVVYPCLINANVEKFPRKWAMNFEALKADLDQQSHPDVAVEVTEADRVINGISIPLGSYIFTMFESVDYLHCCACATNERHPVKCSASVAMAQGPSTSAHVGEQRQQVPTSLPVIRDAATLQHGAATAGVMCGSSHALDARPVLREQGSSTMLHPPPQQNALAATVATAALAPPSAGTDTAAPSCARRKVPRVSQIHSHVEIVIANGRSSFEPREVLALKVTVCDEAKSPFIGAKNHVQIITCDSFELIKLTDRAPGIFEVLVKTPMAVGKYPLAIGIGSCVLTNVVVNGVCLDEPLVVSVHPGKPILSKSTIKCPNTHVKPMQVVQVAVVLRDEFGNEISVEDSLRSLQVCLVNDLQSNMKCERKFVRDNSCVLELVFLSRGSYEVSVFSGTHHLDNFRFDVDGGDEAFAKHCILRSPSTVCHNGSPSHVTIEVRDLTDKALGALPQSMSIFVASVDAIPLAPLIEVTSSSARRVGNASFFFELPMFKLSPGDYTLHAQLSGVDVKGSPQAVQLTVNAAYLERILLEEEASAGPLLKMYDNVISDINACNFVHDAYAKQVESLQAKITTLSAAGTNEELAQYYAEELKKLLEVAIPATNHQSGQLYVRKHRLHSEATEMRDRILTKRMYLSLLR